MPSFQERRPARPTLDKLWLFRNHPVFGQLAPDQIEHLCSYAQTRRVTRETTIFKKGDPGDSLFAIAAGTVKIDVPSAGGREAVFSLVEEGEILGEIALLDGQPRSAIDSGRFTGHPPHKTGRLESCSSNLQVQTPGNVGGIKAE